MRVLRAGVIACALTIAWAGCGNGNEGKSDGSIHDVPPCYQPPTIDKCLLTSYSGTMLYKCTCGGSCGGGGPASACSEWTNDCRYFYNACIPETYSTCGREATDRIAGLCGMCFFTDGGLRPVDKPLPQECNKLTAK